VVSLLSYSGTIYLGCAPLNPSYVSCTLSPPTVSVTTSSTTTSPAVTVASICSPATLPVGYGFNGTVSANCLLQTTTSKLVLHPDSFGRSASKTVLAFLPLGILAFCVRRKRRLSRALWMVFMTLMVGVGLNGCADTSVHYYTPIPSGPQTVTVYACNVQADCTSPISGTVKSGAPATELIRSFTIPITIE
jgi:hypothetical protein